MPSNQQLEAATYMKPTFTLTIKKERVIDIISITRSFLTLTEIILSQPLFMIKDPILLQLLILFLQYQIKTQQIDEDLA